MSVGTVRKPRDHATKPMSVRVDRLERAVTTHARLISKHNTRIERLEKVLLILEEVPALLTKIKKYIKIWGPIIATAALTSGVVKGPIADFISNIMHAVSSV